MPDDLDEIAKAAAPYPKGSTIRQRREAEQLRRVNRASNVLGTIASILIGVGVIVFRLSCR